MAAQLLVKRGEDFTYPIVFEEDYSCLASTLHEVGLAGAPVMIVTDSNVGPLYLSQVIEALSKVSPMVLVHTIPAGERNKHLGTVAEIYTALVQAGMDRTCFLAALGGGVVGDITGFAAATYLRGVDFIQLPTTLLSQVDSSVGGKTGVDLNQYKNMVGAFHQPRLVYMNLNTLRSLPEAELASGMGEVLKTGLICDAAFFRGVCADYTVLRRFEFVPLCATIRRCCEIKAQVVEKDPQEKGERALLNLGHTIGHAVEKLKNFALPHGQCVGLGLSAAAAISRNRGLLSAKEVEEIRSALSLCSLPLTTDGLSEQEVLWATKKDKKMEHGKVKFILMDGIGRTFIDRTVSDEELLAGIREILI